MSAIIKNSLKYLYLRPVMNLSDIAVAEELSEPEFTHHPDSFFPSVFQLLGRVHYLQKFFLNHPFLCSFLLVRLCEFQKLLVMTMLIGQSWYELVTHMHIHGVRTCSQNSDLLTSLLFRTPFNKSTSSP